MEEIERRQDPPASALSIVTHRMGHGVKLAWTGALNALDCLHFGGSVMARAGAYLLMAPMPLLACIIHDHLGAWLFSAEEWKFLGDYRGGNVAVTTICMLGMMLMNALMFSRTFGHDVSRFRQTLALGGLTLGTTLSSSFGLLGAKLYLFLGNSMLTPEQVASHDDLMKFSLGLLVVAGYLCAMASVIVGSVMAWMSLNDAGMSDTLNFDDGWKNRMKELSAARKARAEKLRLSA